MYVIGNFF